MILFLCITYAYTRLERAANLLHVQASSSCPVIAHCTIHSWICSMISCLCDKVYQNKYMPCNFILVFSISKLAISAVYVTPTWWCHQKEIFSASLALCAGKSPVNSLHKSQWRRALIFSLICAWINRRVKNRKAGDLRRHGAHYDVIVMTLPCMS